jgi:hypothetical protein
MRCSHPCTTQSDKACKSTPRGNYLRHTDTSSRLRVAGLADTTLPNLGSTPRNMFMERSTYLAQHMVRGAMNDNGDCSLQKAATRGVRLR